MTRRTLTVALGTLALTACFGSSGGDGSGEGGTRPDGVPRGTTGSLPPTTPLADVSMAELQQVCEENLALVQMSFANLEFQCLEYAFEVASDPAECETLRSECIANEAGNGGDTCSFSDGGPDFAGCTSVTIREMLTCMEDYAALAKTASCSDGQLQYPASCMTAAEACPGVF